MSAMLHKHWCENTGTFEYDLVAKKIIKERKERRLGEAMTNFEKIKSLEVFELAVVINNLGEDFCNEMCPRYAEDRCNEDCDNGLREWLTKEYNANSRAWRNL